MNHYCLKLAKNTSPDFIHSTYSHSFNNCCTVISLVICGQEAGPCQKALRFHLSSGKCFEGSFFLGILYVDLTSLRFTVYACLSNVVIKEAYATTPDMDIFLKGARVRFFMKTSFPMK